jgi:superfamily II DNA or RNA helicase
MSAERTREYKIKESKYVDMLTKSQIAKFKDVDGFADHVKSMGVTVKKIYNTEYYAVAPKDTLKALEKSNKSKKKIDFRILKPIDTVRYSFFNQYWYSQPVYKNHITSVIRQHQSENQAVFFNNLKDLFLMQETLESLGITSRVFHGGVSVKDRDVIKREIEDKSGTVLLANYQVFSTGVSIKRIHRIHFFNGSKAFSRFLQSWGRVIRKHPEIPIVYCHDYSIRLHGTTKKSTGYSYQHYIERKKMLKYDLGYELEETELDI